MSTFDRDATLERHYHHGNLRLALVRAGVETARSEGPDAVVLRAATRSAGVSPNAAYRHFAGREDLLVAVAAECRRLMAMDLEAHLPGGAPDTADAAWAQLRALGRAYVNFACAEPGWFHTAFSCPFDPEEVVPAEGHDLFGLLVGVLDDLEETGAISTEQRQGAEYVAWSAVHGLGSLLADGPLRDLPPARRDAAIDRLVNAVSF